MFWYLLIGMLIVFVIMFVMVRSGWLTITWVGVDALLIKVQPIAEELLSFDFNSVLTSVQHGWLVLTATALLAITRVRGKIKEMMSDGDGHVSL